MAYRSAMELYAEHVPGGVAAVVDALRDDELRAFARQPFLASSWYDIVPFLALDTAAAKLRGQSLEAFVREASRRQARTELTGIYKTLIRMLSAGAVANVLPRLTAQYYDFGRMRTCETRSDGATIEYAGVPTSMAQWLTWVGSEYLGVALELCGMRVTELALVRIQADGEAHGQPVSRVQFRAGWTRA